MSNPIRAVSIDNNFFITGLATHDVEILTTYRTPVDARDTHNYWAHIDGLDTYEARGATAWGAAEALCARFIKDIADPEAFLNYLAACERVAHEEIGEKFGSPESRERMARMDAYRAAAQIVHAAKLLVQPTAAQRRLWDRMAYAKGVHEGDIDPEDKLVKRIYLGEEPDAPKPATGAAVAFVSAGFGGPVGPILRAHADGTVTQADVDAWQRECAEFVEHQRRGVHGTIRIVSARASLVEALGIEPGADLIVSHPDDGSVGTEAV